jgi:hypothetical protein
VDAPGHEDAAMQALSEEFITQVESLPSHVKAALTVTNKGGLMIFSLPFVDGAMALVAFAEKTDGRILALHIVGPRGGASRDVTKQANTAGALRNLGSVYAWLLERVTDTCRARPARDTELGRSREDARHDAEDASPNGSELEHRDRGA